MSGKPRSAALLQLNQNKRNAAATLKARGKKANMGSMMALVKHRRAGKSNDEYFNALNSSTANAVALATGAAAEYEVTSAAAGNTTAKKARTPAQAAANQRRRNAIAVLKASGLKANAGSVKRYLNGQMTAERIKNEAILKGLEEDTSDSASATLSHADAGKKAASSAKGSAWLDQITAAKSNLNSAFAEVGLNKKATRANAMRLASTRRTNPGQARNLELNILSNAQGKAFNKNKNRTAKKSSKQRNNLNRRTRNFVNRRRNRLTRKPVRNYGTMNATKRNTNNIYRPFKGNNNNFNIETFRNVPFNSSQ